MRSLLPLIFALAAAPVSAGDLVLNTTRVTEWKYVYATVEPRRTIPARARIGGTVAALDVTEGMTVTAEAAIGRVDDQKLNFQLAAVAAQITSAEAQLENARTELKRGETLTERGVTSAQRTDSLRTGVNVAEGQLLALRAERDRVQQTMQEGEVLAPADGIVLSVPVAVGAVIQPGEPVAMVGAGGFFLRLQVPERYAGELVEGGQIDVGEGEDARTGKLAKVYPLIEGGRVQADIEVADIDARFVGRRVAVRLPVGERETLAVPAKAISHRDGLDFVQVRSGDAVAERVVLPGGPVDDGSIEIVAGLAAGETVVIADE